MNWLTSFFPKVVAAARPHRWILAALAGALLLRLWLLGSLPPGATPAEAAAGLAGLNLLHKGWLWSAGITPLNLAYSWLAVPFLAIGHGLGWLRLEAVVAGLAAMWGAYLWLRDQNSRQDGLLAAVVLAALAWALALSREATGASLIPAVAAWALWLAGRPGKKAALALAGLAGLGFYASPSLWWLWVLGLISLAVRRRLTDSLVPVGVWAVLVAPALIWTAVHPARLGDYFAVTGSLHRLGQFLVHTIAAGGDWQLTVGSQPLFNAFYAIMAVLGLVVCLLHWRVRLAILGPLLAGLLAGTFDPSGEGFALALVPLVGLIVIGIATMLEWWYATFPINAAARSSGRLAIGLIMALAAYQGYVQYFVAFAGSTQTYALYREDAWAMAADAGRHPDALVITDQPARAIISYRTYPQAVHFATIKELKSSPKANYYLIGYAQRAAVETALAGIAPGGKLRPQTSTFDNRDLYYVYQTK